MTIDMAFIILFILLLFTFIIIVYINNEEYRELFPTKKKVDKLKNNTQPINVELIDVFLIVKDINTNKKYCVFIDRNPDMVGIELKRYNNNVLFSHSWVAIREEKKVIGYKYTAIIKKMDKDEDIKLHDIGQLWIMKKNVSNNLVETINSEKALKNCYINNLNHERIFNKKDRKLRGKQTLRRHVPVWHSLPICCGSRGISRQAAMSPHLCHSRVVATQISVLSVADICGRHLPLSVRSR